MLLKIFGALLLSFLLWVLCKALIKRYHSHWKPWIGIGLVLSYDDKTKKVTISTYLLNSPAGWAKIKRGSVLISRNGELADFESKEAFRTWLDSREKALIGDEVSYRLLEPADKNDWVERIVTLSYQKLHGGIPQYAPLPTAEEMHNDWRQLMPNFKAVYPHYRCPRTGVIYHRVRIIQVGEF